MFSALRLEVKIYDTPAGGIRASHGTFSSLCSIDRSNIHVESDNLTLSDEIIKGHINNLFRQWRNDDPLGS